MALRNCLHPEEARDPGGSADSSKIDGFLTEEKPMSPSDVPTFVGKVGPGRNPHRGSEEDKFAYQ